MDQTSDIACFQILDIRHQTSDSAPSFNSSPRAGNMQHAMFDVESYHVPISIN
jgi:hypothetical protein